MNSWYDPRTEETHDFEPPYIEVDVDDAPPVVLWGPDGEVLIEVRRLFGFQPARKVSDGRPR